MDVDAMTYEIIAIRNRLDELDAHPENATAANVEDERKELYTRMRHLQDELTDPAEGERERTRPPGETHPVPPM